MPAATVDSNASRSDTANRRLAVGLAMSLLLHGFVLSLQFGLPGRALGELRRITVRLAPVRPPAAVAPPSPVSVPAPVKAGGGAARSAGAVATSDARPVDLAAAPASAPRKAHTRRKRGHPKLGSRVEAKPKRGALSERVIASEQKSRGFTVAQPEPGTAHGAQAGDEAGTGRDAPKTDVVVAARGEGTDGARRDVIERAVQHQRREDDALVRRLEEKRAATASTLELENQRKAAEALAREQQRIAAETLAQQDQQALLRQREEEQRTAEAREREQRRQLEMAREKEAERLAAEELARERATREAEQVQARQLAEQERAAQEQLERQMREAQLQRQAERELAARRQEEARQTELHQRQMAQEAAQRQAEEQALRLAEQRQAEEQARSLAEQRLAEEQARRLAEQRLAEEQARRLAQQRQAEEQARKLAEQRQAEEQARRSAEQRQAEEQARRLAEQRQAEEQARLLAAQRQAEQLAQERRAQELARQQEAAGKERAEEEARRLAAGPAASALDTGKGTGAGAGTGRGLPLGTLGGGMLASRARELVRGLGVLGTPPAPLQPEQSERQKRRLVSSAAERDVPLRLYLDSIRQKIERNGTLNGGQLAADRVRVDPVVSVAIRSDGSVEDVMIVRSSGRSDLDDAVRRIVRLNARYAVFPPNVAAHYDVIELRRIWTFADGLKLLEEVR